MLVYQYTGILVKPLKQDEITLLDALRAATKILKYQYTCAGRTRTDDVAKILKYQYTCAATKILEYQYSNTSIPAKSPFLTRSAQVYQYLSILVAGSSGNTRDPQPFRFFLRLCPCFCFCVSFARGARFFFRFIFFLVAFCAGRGFFQCALQFD